MGAIIMFIAFIIICGRMEKNNKKAVEEWLNED